MRETQDRSEKNKIITTAIFMITILVLVVNSTNLLKKSAEVFVVAEGALDYEEPAEGYIIRDEMVLQGETYKNGMVKVISDGERVAKDQIVFRYYSSSEEAIMKQINDIDEEINEIIENSGFPSVSSDISSLDVQIEECIDSMHNVNYLQTSYETQNKIEAYISKKAQITGTLSSDKQIEEKNLKKN